MSAYANRVLEATTTEGAGPYTLLGAVVGYQTAQAAGCTAGAVYGYFAEGITDLGALTGLWEVGEGTYAVGVLTPTRVFSSSTGGAKVVWPAGLKRIGLALTAEQFASIGSTTNAAAALVNSAARLIQTQRILAQCVSRGQI
jgi:hypothetical protein